MNKILRITSQPDELPGYFRNQAVESPHVIFHVKDEELDRIFNWQEPSPCPGH